MLQEAHVQNVDQYQILLFVTQQLWRSGKHWFSDAAIPAGIVSTVQMWWLEDKYCLVITRIIEEVDL